MACSAYNPFCEIFMAFYSAINPIVLIEFIDIKDISNPDASQNGKRFQNRYCCFNHLRGDGMRREASNVQPFSTWLKCFGRAKGDES